MKKIIALAVASAFVAPVMASSEVTISGLAEFYYQDANGATSTGFGDHALYFQASTELANGISVSADFNIDAAEDTGTDGGDSIDLSGPFGKVELGVTSNAADKFDDRTDKDVVVNTLSLSGADAAIGWTLPTFAEGLTVYVSHSADENHEDTAAGTGIAFQYSAGPVTVAYADVQADVEANDQTYVGGTLKVNGFTFSAEQMETGANQAEVTERALGATYSVDQFTFAISTEETKGDDGILDSDVTFFGVKYSLGNGVMLFAETSDNDVAEDGEKSAVGVSYAF